MTTGSDESGDGGVNSKRTMMSANRGDRDQRAFEIYISEIPNAPLGRTLLVSRHCRSGEEKIRTVLLWTGQRKPWAG